MNKNLKINENDFEWFNPNIFKPKDAIPKVSISNYSITLNESSLYFLGNPKYVKFGFNKVNNTMCISPCENNIDYAMEVIIKKTPSVYSKFNCKSLIDFLETNKKNQFKHSTKRFKAQYSNKILIINLNTKKN